MKRLLAYVLSFVVLGSSLFPGFDPEELYKVPDLLAHYAEHQQTEDIAFLQFLALHYLPGTGHKDTHDHSKLPLFEHHHFHAVYFVLQLPHISWQPVLYTHAIEHCSAMRELSPRLHARELLRPPRA